MYFSVNCKKLRKAKGLTQAELSKKIGLNPTAVSAWEAQRSHPNANTLIELSTLFKVSIDDLLKVDLSRERISPPESPTIQDKSSTYIKALEVAIRSRCPDLAKDLGLK